MHQCRLADDHGASSIEYAILASVLALVIIGSVALVGTSVNRLYCSVAEAMPFAGGVC